MFRIRNRVNRNRKWICNFLLCTDPDPQLKKVSDPTYPVPKYYYKSPKVHVTTVTSHYTDTHSFIQIFQYELPTDHKPSIVPLIEQCKIKLNILSFKCLHLTFYKTCKSPKMLVILGTMYSFVICLLAMTLL